jgi:hypothetical protein
MGEKIMRLLRLILMLIPMLALAQSPTRLFNGTSLKGWTVLGNGSWVVSNGEIIAKQTAANPHFTHLIQDTVLKDFRISFLFKTVKGNAGFFFRLQNVPTLPDSLNGVQVVIDPNLQSDDAFGLYETNGRFWLNKWNFNQHRNQYPNASNCMMKWDSPKLAANQGVADTNCRKTLYNPENWNRISVWTKGPRIIVKLNMRTIVDTTDPKLDRAGKFAFKLHQGQDVEIHFKDVEISPLLDFPAGLKSKLKKVLLYKGEAASPPQLRAFLKEIAKENDIVLEEGVEADFNKTNLAQYQAALFLSDYNVNFNPTQRTDFENWFKQDHGSLCMHACTRQEITQTWPWWGEAMGTQLADHTSFKERAVALDAEASQRPLWKNFDKQTYTWRDEWFHWVASPRGKTGVTVLLEYADDGVASDLAPKGLPHAWIRSSQGGRFLGWGAMHTMNSMEIPFTYEFLLNALRDVGGYDTVQTFVKPQAKVFYTAPKLTYIGNKIQVQGMEEFSIQVCEANGNLILQRESGKENRLELILPAVSKMLFLIVKSKGGIAIQKLMLSGGILLGG